MWLSLPTAQTDMCQSQLLWPFKGSDSKHIKLFLGRTLNVMCLVTDCSMSSSKSCFKHVVKLLPFQGRLNLSAWLRCLVLRQSVGRRPVINGFGVGFGLLRKLSYSARSSLLNRSSDETEGRALLKHTIWWWYLCHPTRQRRVTWFFSGRM